MKTYYVYILRCADQSYYTGITDDLNRRIAEHQDGMDRSCYTYRRRPVQLMTHVEFRDVNQAIAFEKRVKGWSRAKKEALITGEWDKLPGLSRSKTHRSHVSTSLPAGKAGST